MKTVTAVTSCAALIGLIDAAVLQSSGNAQLQVRDLSHRREYHEVLSDQYEICQGMLEMARKHVDQEVMLQKKVAADLGKEMATHVCKPRVLSSRGYRAPSKEDNMKLAERLDACQMKTIDILEVAKSAETNLQKMYIAVLTDGKSLAQQNKTVPFCPEIAGPQPAADNSVNSTVVTRDLPEKWHEQSIEATERFQKWLNFMSLDLMTEVFQGRTDRTEFTSALFFEISDLKEELADLNEELADLKGRKNGTATTATITPKFQNATATASLLIKPALVNSTAGYHPSSSKVIPGYHPSSISSPSSALGDFAESSSVRNPVEASSKAPIYPVMSESEDVQVAEVTAAPSQASYVPTSSEDEEEEDADEE